MIEPAVTPQVGRLQGPKRLLVVSHALHCEHAGQLYAYGPYAREIDIWADLFEAIDIAAPFRRGEPPGDYVPFTRSNIVMRPQPDIGGDSVRAKIELAIALPGIMIRLARSMRGAEAIHVRCPGNLGLLGAILAPMFSRRLVAKYAGQWNGYVGESAVTRLQRWLLSSSWWHGPVTVYGNWPNQPAHIVSFFTSMMTAEQVRRAVAVAATKRIESPLRVLFSGSLQARKRVGALIEAVKLLTARGVPVELAIVGDGQEREPLRKQAGDLEARGVVRFIGALPYDESLAWFEWAHCLVLPSRHSEGWPKVIAEGMCYGTVCVGVAHGQVPTMLAGRGVLLPTGSPTEIADALRDVAENPARYQSMMHDASLWARQFSLDDLRSALAALLTTRWHLDKPRGNALSARNVPVSGQSPL